MLASPLAFLNELRLYVRPGTPEANIVNSAHSPLARSTKQAILPRYLFDPPLLVFWMGYGKWGVLEGSRALLKVALAGFF